MLCSGFPRAAGFLCVALAVLEVNSLCSPGWPRTQKSACLCLPSAEIKGVHHHCAAGKAESCLREQQAAKKHDVRESTPGYFDVTPASYPHTY
ncbi:mCG1026625 [Mus musculus]|nr:mCG1026625 [Mus musculus]